MVKSSIHPTAIVSPNATIGPGSTIGPYAVIFDGVKIGDRVWVGAHSVIGAQPEIKNFDQRQREENFFSVLIGDDVVIREGAQVHSGSARTTVISNGVFLMNQSYIAHDCVLGNDVVVSSGVRIAGHANIGDYVNLGLNATVHQHVTVGAGAMIGMSAAVIRNVPACAKVAGVPAKIIGVNQVGLDRLGVSNNEFRGQAKLLHGWSSEDFEMI